MAPAAMAAGKANLMTGATSTPDKEDPPLDLQKLTEAMTLAVQLGMGFCEATEIYSGFDGKLN